MPFTSIAEFEATESPTTAERKLIAAVRAGEGCLLNDGTRPTAASDANEIRADLLRLLIVGGTTGCGLHESGVWLEGAYITGMLDLRFKMARGQCVLDACHFTKRPNLTQAKLPQLSLQGIQLPGLFAQGVKITGSLFLRNLIATGTVHMNGAQISGQLDCSGATLDGAGGKALNAQRITTGEDMFLRNLTSTGTVDVNGAQIGGQLACEGAKLDGAGGKAMYAQGITTGASLFLCNLTSTGTVAVSGAKIGGQLICTGATLDGAGGDALNAQGITTADDLFLRNLTATGTVAVNGAQIGGQLDCTGAKLNGAGRDALFAQSLRVSDVFLWRGISACNGKMNLNTAHVATLVDDPESWAKVDSLNLDGFSYDRITASPTDAKTRLEWLRKGSITDGQFLPQPYTQLAKVLREMGHASEARKILMERESRLFAAAHSVSLAALNRARSNNDGDVGWAWLRYHLLRLWAWFTRTFSGYGHAPQYALFWSLGFVAFGTVWFFIAWQTGVMVPNSDVILTSGEWAKAMALNHDAPTPSWGAMNAARHYETFYSLPYALDVFVPLVSMGQENAWSASTVGWFGWATRMFTFVYQIAGWAITALGVASITGFVQKNQPD